LIRALLLKIAVLFLFFRSGIPLLIFYRRKTKDDKIPGNKSLIRLCIKANHGKRAGMAEIP
jgi:hypothetical protein